MNEASFNCSSAIDSDVPALVQLMNEEGCQEEGIVVPPKKFRESYFKGAIEDGHLYVIKDGSTIVGYKKLFLMDDQEKRNAILENEIRSQGAHAKPLMHGIVRVDGTTVMFEDASTQSHGTKPVYIYNGGDFTKKRYRGRGLNKQLMCAALNAIKEKTKEHLKATDSNAVNIVYGITESNGAFEQGSSSDRTNPIAKSFLPFAQSIATELKKEGSKNTLYHERFKAYKPSFDPESKECVPLSDEFSVEGAGVVLSYPLNLVEEEK